MSGNRAAFAYLDRIGAADSLAGPAEAGFPFVDLASGGSVKGLTVALDKIAAELPADVKVIPGHGKVSTLEDVKKLSATLKDCLKLVEAQVKKNVMSNRYCVIPR